jgi:antitoxin VapB
MRVGRDSRLASAYFYQVDDGFYHGKAMGAQLNIKSEDAYRLASRLSELTGESLTTVVTRALQAELERQERQRDIDATVERMLQMGKEIRAHMREPVSSDTSWMYDENGLPK